MTNPKYDVAISFLEKDEVIALKLHKALSKSLNSFIYTEQQKNLQGRDGEELLNKIFLEDSRIVVILHRNDWGKTKWTRIEETAIKNRGFENGYDFVKFIPLDKPVVNPKWIPRNRIWIGLETHGIEVAAAVIESLAQEFEATLKIESTAEKAARIEKSRILQESRDKLIDSQEGGNYANSERNKIGDLIKKEIEEFNKKNSDWHFNFNSGINNVNGFELTIHGSRLLFQFQGFRSTGKEYILFITLIITYRHKPQKEQAGAKLRFDINEMDETGWSSYDKKEIFLSSEKLVHEWFARLVEIGLQVRAGQL